VISVAAPLLVVGGVHGGSGAEFLWESAPGCLRSFESMSDLMFVAASVVFFAVAVWYVNGCQSLTKGGRDV
jgi:hypothetical protein